MLLFWASSRLHGDVPCVLASHRPPWRRPWLYLQSHIARAASQSHWGKRHRSARRRPGTSSGGLHGQDRRRAQRASQGVARVLRAWGRRAAPSLRRGACEALRRGPRRRGRCRRHGHHQRGGLRPAAHRCVPAGRPAVLRHRREPQPQDRPGRRGGGRAPGVPRGGHGHHRGVRASPHVVSLRRTARAPGEGGAGGAVVRARGQRARVRL